MKSQGGVSVVLVLLVVVVKFTFVYGSQDLVFNAFWKGLNRGRRFPFVILQQPHTTNPAKDSPYTSSINYSLLDRALQQFDEESGSTTTTQKEVCALCHGAATVLEDALPKYTWDFFPPNQTCGELYDIIATNVPKDFDSWDSACAFLLRGLEGQCCGFTPYQCAQDVRSALLGANYDAAVAPLDRQSSSIDVGLEMNFYHVTELSVKSGIVEIFVWIMLNWTDPRLAWDHHQAGNDDNNNNSNIDCGISSFTARASLDKEKAEIWVPDMDLYNQVSGVQNMPDAMATVYRDGSVQWRRNGGLKALCSFTGLRQFPYDTLGCQFLLGGWTRDVNVAFHLVGGDGFYFGGEFNRYTEYRLLDELVETGYLDNVTKDSVYYNFYFQRSQRFYVTKIVIPAIIFTMLSFGVFLLDLRVGERLTYGLTVLLVITAQDIVISEFLPVTNQRLWINVFVNGSFYWVLIANLESVFVLWMYFLGDEYQEQEQLLRVPYEQEEGQNKTNNGASLSRRNHQHAAPGKRIIVGRSVVLNEEGVVVEQEDSSSDDVEYTDEGRQDVSSSNKEGEASEQQLLESFAIPEVPTTTTTTAPNNNTTTFTQTLKQQFQSRGGGGRHPWRRRMRYQLVKKIDRYAFILVPMSYIVFVIIMLLTRDLNLWKDDDELEEE